MIIEERINCLVVEANSLKRALEYSTSDIGDWKVIKCYEASLLNKEMPYDLQDLLTKRQQARDRINEIESILPGLRKQASGG